MRHERATSQQRLMCRGLVIATRQLTVVVLEMFSWSHSCRPTCGLLEQPWRLVSVVASLGEEAMYASCEARVAAHLPMVWKACLGAADVFLDLADRYSRSE